MFDNRKRKNIQILVKPILDASFGHKQWISQWEHIDLGHLLVVLVNLA